MSLQDELNKASMWLDAERQQVLDETIDWIAAHASKDERGATFRAMRHHINPALAPDWTPADETVSNIVFKRLPPALAARIRAVGDRRAD